MLEKTYRPSEVEEKHYANWEGTGAFAAQVESNRAPYTIMMPPPNVTGSLHIGHALTFTVQDILIRYQRMTGRDALWQPGMDHAGIATQMVVERELAKEDLKRRDLGREAFVERVWDWKAESGGTIARQLRRLGASPDWPRERFTMDEGLSKAVRKVFVDLYKQGLIYKDQRLVNWDPKLHTAISDLEVEQKEVTGKLWHFRYPIEGEEGRYLVVATTRPETMLGDTGVAVHPDDDRYKDLVGKHVILPLVGRRIPVVADNYADPETGSGAVKMTPAHDFNDFEVGRRQNLEIVNIFDENAHLNDNVPETYRGLDRFAARDMVVADLEAAGLLEKVDTHVHKVPHGDRGGVPIEPWLTEQWYADAETLAEPAIEAVESGKTVFVPKRWENTYFEWMRNIQPWCISRQLWWGHRIPAWYGPDGEVFVEMSEEEAQAAAKAHYGKAVALEQDPDVLDTWFSSALWPFSTIGWPEETPELKRYYPGDVLVTGFDIIFFWVARMMMMGIHFMGEVPFHTVYIHGLVRDEHGDKMSKAKGNVVDPLEKIDKYGADALRFTLAALSSPSGQDLKLSEDRMDADRKFCTKLWNAARLAEMNEARLDPAFDPSSVTAPLNRWIVSEVAKLGRDLSGALDAYRFSDAANILYHFVWHSFCDWYLEFIKPVLRSNDEAVKAETRTTTAWAFSRVLHLLHPIMPFVTEELWENLAGEGASALITDSWPEFDLDLIDEEATAEMEWCIELITNARSTRNEQKIPPAARTDLVLINASDLVRRAIAHQQDSIAFVGRMKSFGFADGEPPQGAMQVLVEGVQAFLRLSDDVDPAKERERLQKEMANAEGEIAGAQKHLSNEQFLAKAKPEAVEKQRQRLANAQAKLAELKQALARLEDD